MKKYVTSRTEGYYFLIYSKVADFSLWQLTQLFFKLQE